MSGQDRPAASTATSSTSQDPKPDPYSDQMKEITLDPINGPDSHKIHDLIAEAKKISYDTKHSVEYWSLMVRKLDKAAKEEIRKQNETRAIVYLMRARLLTGEYLPKHPEYLGMPEYEKKSILKADGIITADLFSIVKKMEQNLADAAKAKEEADKAAKEGEPKNDNAKPSTDPKKSKSKGRDKSKSKYNSEKGHDTSPTETIKAFLKKGPFAKLSSHSSVDSIVTNGLEPLPVSQFSDENPYIPTAVMAASVVPPKHTFADLIAKAAAAESSSSPSPSRSNSASTTRTTSTTSSHSHPHQTRRSSISKGRRNDLNVHKHPSHASSTAHHLIALQQRSSTRIVIPDAKVDKNLPNLPSDDSDSSDYPTEDEEGSSEEGSSSEEANIPIEVQGPSTARASKAHSGSSSRVNHQERQSSPSKGGPSRSPSVQSRRSWHSQEYRGGSPSWEVEHRDDYYEQAPPPSYEDVIAEDFSPAASRLSINTVPLQPNQDVLGSKSTTPQRLTPTTAIDTRALFHSALWGDTLPSPGSVPVDHAVEGPYPNPYDIPDPHYHAALSPSNTCPPDQNYFPEHSRPSSRQSTRSTKRIQ